MAFKQVTVILETEASLYIHIPFCASLCDYCDFYSININNVNDDYINAYLSALLTDIKNQIDNFSVKKIPTAYIGGGTPSVLGNKIEILLDGLKKIEIFSPVEFTIEANPESINEEFLSLCREGGVTRLSLGIQTFNEKSRVALNRTAGVTEEKLYLATRFFPDSLSFDLITGLPFQTEKNILKDIKSLLAYKPSHISLYSLTIENNTPLKDKIKNKTVLLPDSECADSIWLSGKEALLKEGFDHYEISNFARGGKECLHNIRYWLMQNWIASGPSASGTIIDEDAAAAVRYTNINDINAYIKAISNEQQQSLLQNVNFEKLDRATLLKESILMGFRYKEGPDPVLFKKRFGFTVEQCIGKTLNKWKDKDKMLFLNSFLCDAFFELEKI